LNLRLLFINQRKLKLSFVFKWLDISELTMPKLVDLCDKKMVTKEHVPDLHKKAGSKRHCQASFFCPTEIIRASLWSERNGATTV
jgi:hypothetical protein